MSNVGVYLILFLILVWAILPLSQPSFFAAHDAVWHIARFWQFHLSLTSFQIPVRWAPTLFYGLGYPAFIVNFHLPYYLMELIHFAGFNLVNTFKILLALSYLISGYFCFIFLKNLFGKTAAFGGSILYAYSPYRFATIYTRGAIGEALAFAFIPMVFWALERFSTGKKYFGPVFSLSVFLLIISHPSIFLIFTPLLILTIITLNINSKLKIIKAFVWLVLGVIASAFQTLPALFERQYLEFDKVYKNVYLGHFPNLFSLFRLPFGGVDLGTPFQIGIVNWIVIFLAIILSTLLLVRRKTGKAERIIVICTISFFGGLFLMTTMSSWIWANVPLISSIVFPWRFLSLLVFVSAVLGAYLIAKIKYKFLVMGFVVILVVFSSRHYWGWTGTIPGDDNYYKNYNETTTAEGEFTPKGVSQNIKNYSQPPVEIIEGSAEVTGQRLTANNWQFNIDAKSNNVSKLAILNFPGWKVSVDKKEVDIIGDYVKGEKDLRGLILFETEKGMHTVSVNFAETRLRVMADLLSLSTLVFLFLWLLKAKFNLISPLFLKISFLNRELVILVIIVAVGASLRLVKLGEVPPGPYLDEAWYGLDAYSILKTGRDVYEHTLPLAFQSVGYIPPVYNYLLIPLVAIFGLSIWVIRLPTAISGILIILFCFLVARELVPKKKSLVPAISALIVALSTWNIHFSRVAFIASFGMIFPLVGIFLFLKSRQKPFYLILSAVFFGIATQVHHDGYKLISPFIFGILFALNWQFIKNTFNKKVIAVVFLVWFVTISINWAAFHFYNAGFRAHALLNLSPKGIVLEYLKTYSPNFLFFEGDRDPMRNPWLEGELLPILLPFLLIGLLNLKFLSKEGKVVVGGWLLIAPLPSAIAGYGDHALRNSLLIIPLGIIIALGIERLVIKGKKSLFWLSILLVTISIFIFQSANQFYYYFHNYSKDYSLLWGESLRESVNFAYEEKSNYDQVIFTDVYNSTLAFFAFKTRLSAKNLQDAILLPEIFNDTSVKRTGKFYFVPMEEEKSKDWYLRLPKKSLIIDPHFSLEGEQFVTEEKDGHKLFQYLAI